MKTTIPTPEGHRDVLVVLRMIKQNRNILHRHVLWLHIRGLAQEWDRKALPRGRFGAVAPFFCLECGPCFDKPRLCTEGDNFHEPRVTYWRCPDCNSEDFHENSMPRLGFKAARRGK